MEHKSEHLKLVALANGWKAQIDPKTELFEVSNDPKDIVWHLYALRDRESLHVIWRGNRLEQGLYKYGDHTVKLFWKNEVLKYLEGKPDPGKFKFIADGGDEVSRAVPWEHDTPAIDILLEVAKKEIRWIRNFDDKVISAVVDVNLNEPGSRKYFRVANGKKGRVLEWADALGFHAVALDSIIYVS